MKSFQIIIKGLIYIFSVINLANAGISPSFPIGDSVVRPGETVKIKWIDDGQKPPLSKMPNVAVEFMTGSDLEQVTLAPISKVPGTAKELDWKVPLVEPVGKNLFWTTRFTVTDKDGKFPTETGPIPEVGKNPGGQGKIIDDFSGKGKEQADEKAKGDNKEKIGSGVAPKAEKDVKEPNKNSNTSPSANDKAKDNNYSSSANNYGIQMLNVLLGICVANAFF
ncbi:17057_t:CDS:2 [Funneliformis geosporum]|uniref:12165_t:CDS:1 n=1 Tax=Funneliformis geosporum TaxID=1117311 RepID=A0A9W4SBC6_9GLOM|nr:17057_t:CDS:2 [Funneliformis geosporum]CAI2162396.1 12165_t:CDS:2 [Funneliformis geosporum]